MCDCVILFVFVDVKAKNISWSREQQCCCNTGMGKYSCKWWSPIFLTMSYVSVPNKDGRARRYDHDHALVLLLVKFLKFIALLFQ